MRYFDEKSMFCKQFDPNLITTVYLNIIIDNLYVMYGLYVYYMYVHIIYTFITTNLLIFVKCVVTK